MANETISLVRRVRRWLSLRLLASEASFRSACGLALGNALLFSLNLFLPPRAGWIFPLVGLALGAGMGLLASRRRAVSAMEAAEWVDRRQRTKSLMGAALHCLGRGLTGPLDARILERADKAALDAGGLRPSFLPIRRRLFLSAAIAAASFLPFGFLGSSRSIGEESFQARQADAESPSAAGDQRPLAGTLSAEEAKEQARALFPDDERKRSLAEKALREGRNQDLRELAERAMKELDARIQASTSLLERHDLELKKRDLAAAAERLRSAASRPAAAKDPEAREGDKSVAVEFLPFERKQKDSERVEGPRSIEGGQGQDSKGSIAGEGRGSQTDRGRIEARATGERIELRKGETPDISELMEAAERAAVAPGRAAWAGRAEEGASGGAVLPLDYQRDVESYFTALERLARSAAADKTEGDKR